MRIRHRIPSIFSLSMVDVLCCALGCVILLWLLNAKQLDDEAEEQAQATKELLERTRQEREESEALLSAYKSDQATKDTMLAQFRSERDSARTLLTDVQVELRALTATRSALEKQLAEQQAMARDLKGKLVVSSDRIATLETDLKKGTAMLASEQAKLASELAKSGGLGKKVTALEAKSGGLGKKVTELEAVVRGLRSDLETSRTRHTAEEARSQGMEKDLARMEKDIQTLGKTLEELQGARRGLEASLAAREKALSMALPYKDRWATAEARATDLERQLKDAQGALLRSARTLTTLEGEKKDLLKSVAAARAAADNRFAGIELTGKRVIFLVDVSGSMELVDETTPAPNKWIEVRNTVHRLMRSLPDLEKFQIIVFSNKTSYLLGGDDRWIDHDPKTSPDHALNALATVKPSGGTNMYDALKTAFRFRARGLDTIYFLSDGLPNQGPGLPLDSGKLADQKRGQLLGRYVRATLRSDWNVTDPRYPKVRINTIGFFYESPDLGSFLWALAREHDGSFVGMAQP